MHAKAFKIVALPGDDHIAAEPAKHRTPLSVRRVEPTGTIAFHQKTSDLDEVVARIATLGHGGLPAEQRCVARVQRISQHVKLIAGIVAVGLSDGCGTGEPEHLDQRRAQGARAALPNDERSWRIGRAESYHHRADRGQGVRPPVVRAQSQSVADHSRPKVGSHAQVHEAGLHGVDLHDVGQVLDATTGEISVNVSEADLAERAKSWKPRASEYGSGAIWKYAQLVGPARYGALTAPGAEKENHGYADI